jgi:spheroidene monooxygenase
MLHVKPEAATPDPLAPAGASAGHPVIALTVFRYAGLWNRLWAFSQMGFARFSLPALPGLGFFKLFGTGTGEGFTPVPNPGVYAQLTTWPSLDIARQRATEAPVFRRFRAHATEALTIYMTAISARGQWDGVAPFAVVKPETVPLPMAVLTRATVKPRHVLSFWSQTPDISVLVKDQPHLLFKIGMGEVPWFQQVTFSIWDDIEAMKAFAYASAQHGGAVRKVRDNRWFREELYARFAVLGIEGSWNGHKPASVPVAPLSV